MRLKKIGTINGLALGLFCIFGAFLIEGGSLKALFLIPPILIVFGGTFSAVIVGFGFEKFKMIFQLMKLAYFPKKYNYKETVDNFAEIAIELRKNGILAVERMLDRFEHYFPKKLIKFFIDGADVDEIDNLARMEMKAMQERHFSNIFIFTKMGGYAPTMGILGTVMGLIMTLANAGNDPEELVRNIATAFIATLWGVFSANLIWLPVGDRLKLCHSEEKLLMELTVEGVIALRSGEIPSMVKTRLLSMLPPKDQEEKKNA